MAPPREALTFPFSKATLIDPYLPSTNPTVTPFTSKPFVTLTYATSLDSSISLSPGIQTALSGPQSKAMTHYLRSKHDAILIGCGTAIADDPSLNCRIEGVGGYGGEGLQGQPRPVVLDPKVRWDADEWSKVVELAKDGRGKAPWVLVLEDYVRLVRREYRNALEGVGGKFVAMSSTTKDGWMDWNDILSVLAREGINSVMIEGGGTVITDLLSPRWLCLVDSVIVTIAPTWLGKESVIVIPDERRGEKGYKIPVGRLKEVHWVPLGEDVVLCGRPNAT
ncbi:bacterial bifunctional deaminase-reductase [Lentithecium fluviatile CBS 122367]|uniref:2,5-diamino-6-ribosylamino-4(3H)-pyrimidinone 5'-phosphate reductase n=1 Tax=Lentithecium fluviatile CBS 122367 TaxID=1168545 RepID=A0A6G1JH49_9PLEO|nr:bacterial bifunctional deaminase-reductase [Lentithecium fluviatile CBS 122367]